MFGIWCTVTLLIAAASPPANAADVDIKVYSTFSASFVVVGYARQGMICASIASHSTRNTCRQLKLMGARCTTTQRTQDGLYTTLTMQSPQCILRWRMAIRLVM